MIPNVIKFVSIDGLSLYEPCSQLHTPPKRLKRSVMVPLLVRKKPLTDDYVPDPLHFRVREYEQRTHYIDPQNGNLVWEYGEVM